MTCRVLQIARQPYYRWLAEPVSARRVDEAYLADAIFDAHCDDPELGHRFLAEEARQAGHRACDRTVWRICGDEGWWSAFGKPRPRRTANRAPRHTTISCAGSPPPPPRTGCGSPT